MARILLVCEFYATPGLGDTVFDLISEHTLISGHPPHFVLVKTIARAHRDLCVLCIGCVIVLHHAIDIWC